MGKLRASSSKKAASADEGKSDDQLIQERKERESFALADRFLGFAGWGLTAVAILWWALFSPQAPPSPSIYPPACDGALALLVLGKLCAGLSKASPKGSWSGWRRSWQLCLVPTFLAIGAGIAIVSVGSGTAPLTRGPSLLWAIGCCLGGVVLALTAPKGQSSPGKAASAPLARLLFLTDAGLALAVAASSLALGPWFSQPLGALAAAVTAMPLSVWAAGVGLCNTEAEMLAVLPSAALLWSGAAVRALFLSPSVGGLFMALPSVALVLLHGALFLPLPAEDPESNPFYLSFKKSVNSFTKMMSDTDTGGFADE